MSLDHLAIAVRDEREMSKIFDGILCGKRFGHNPFIPGLPQSVGSWMFNDHKIELISTPIDGGRSLVGAFLSRRPEQDAAFHHVTFIVGEEADSLRTYRARAEELGFIVTGYNENPYGGESWGEFFLSPKSTPGKILVQIAVFKTIEEGLGKEWMSDWKSAFPVSPPQFSCPVQLSGLLLLLNSDEEMQKGHLLFENLLGGRQHVIDGRVVIEFKNSAHSIFLERGASNVASIIMHADDIKNRLSNLPGSLCDVFAALEPKSKI